MVWGALNGIFVISGGLFVGRSVQDSRSGVAARLLKTGRVLVTFCLICLTWVFFRAKSFSDGVLIVRHMFSLHGDSVTETFGMGSVVIATLFVSCAIVVQIARERTRLRQALALQPFWIRWSVYTAALTALLLLGEFQPQQFIYFQF